MGRVLWSIESQEWKKEENDRKYWREWKLLYRRDKQKKGILGIEKKKTVIKKKVEINI